MKTTTFEVNSSSVEVKKQGVTFLRPWLVGDSYLVLVLSLGFCQTGLPGWVDPISEENQREM